jgi:putative DNA primase/helicase
MLSNKQLPETPAWLIAALDTPQRTAANTNSPPARFMAAGSRNNDLTSLAGFLRRRGLEEESLAQQLLSANSASLHPLSETEVRAIAGSVARNYVPDARGEMHDVPLSRIVAQAISDVCRYVPETGWKVYNGRAWVSDQSGILAKERIKCELEAFIESIKASGNTDAVRDARKYLSNNKVNAIAALVISDPNVRADIAEFDQKTSLLNLQNGTLDLSTCMLMPHKPTDFLTKVAKVEYKPEADCPRFKSILSKSLPPEHGAFLLRYLGYALLGAAQEQVFAILYGAGANGKSTLINIISHLLGEYAANVEPATLIRQKGERIRSDIARLRGVHLAVTSELATGEVLDAALVKRFTGGDTITARALYSSEFEYKPKFALIMTTNALPVINGADAALARRLILIPFNTVVEEADRDPTLGTKLEAETSGILNLLLAGLREYQGIGLAVPIDLKEEVGRFAASSDLLALFLDDATEKNEGETAGASDLYSRYRLWCGMSGLGSLSMPQFKRELIKKGYNSKRSKSGQAWQGMRLRRHHL